MNRTRVLFVLALLVPWTALRVHGEEPPVAGAVERACAEAAARVKADDVGGARDRLLAAVEEHPGSGTLHLALARVHLILRDPTAAAEASARALKAKSGWPQALLVNAEARAAQGDIEGALVSLDGILRAGPKKGHVSDFRLARRMLDKRGIGATVAEAAEKGLLPIDLPFALAARLKEVLELLSRGPGWARTYERRSRHFVVRTDANQTVADGLSVYLELAFSAYATILPPVRETAGRPLLVLGFSSRTGYIRSMTKLVGDGRFMPATVGAYVPAAGCLAILVRGQVASVLPVVYHEAFHACADTRIGRLPRWLDEGLAEALSGRLLGKTEPHLRLPVARMTALRASVARSGMPTSASVLALPPAAFSDTRRAPEAYALAWVFADFLLERDATKQGSRTIRTILAAHRAGRTSAAAVKAGLGASPRLALDAAFARHVHRTLGQVRR